MSSNSILRKMKRSRYYEARRECYPARRNGESRGLPCLGMCHKNEHYNNAYVLMAVIRNTLRDGLLLTFVNTTRDDVDLIWRDYDGDNVLIVKFKPGQIHRFSAIATHDFCSQNSKTDQPYLLNDEDLLVGKNLIGAKKDHTILIKPPKNPLTLREMVLTKVACSLKNRYSILGLCAPVSVKFELFYKRMSLDQKDYYSNDGEPGQYFKEYEGEGEGPLIYPPGLDWSPFEQ